MGGDFTKKTGSEWVDKLFMSNIMEGTNFMGF